jgi:hypothetical protein
MIQGETPAVEHEAPRTGFEPMKRLSVDVPKSLHRRKPARPQHQEINEEGAMTQSVNIQYQRHGSAAVALRRLAHPARDGGVVARDDPVSEPINPERGGGVVVGDDPLSPLIRRLSRDMPELLEEIVALVERHTAERNGDDGAAPRPAESVAPAALVLATPTPQDDDAGKTAITLLFDTQVLTRIDADARRIGISRTAWLHVAADERLEGRR